MNRDELDEFFARAEDVLTDWDGGTDAMHAKVPDREPELAMAGDSYYEQGEGWDGPLDINWRPPSPSRRFAWVPYVQSEQVALTWADRVVAEMSQYLIPLSLARSFVARMYEDYPQRALVFDEAALIVGRAYMDHPPIDIDDGLPERIVVGRTYRDCMAMLEPARPTVQPIDTGDSPRDRALAARRNRNTGPADRVGLDGHHRRRNR